MSAERDDMIAGLGEMDHAAQRFAAGYTRYLTALRAASRAVYPNRPQQSELDATVGAERVHCLLVMRLRALGLGPLLDQARTSGPLPDSWLEDLSAKINRFVT